MKISAKQCVILALCLILLFIPTYIAISYYYTNNLETNDRYSVNITDEMGAVITVDPKRTDELAKLFLKVNSKMIALSEMPSRLPSKYYTVSIKDRGNVVCSYIYYMVPEKGEDSYIRSPGGNYYMLKYGDAKSFLTDRIAYHFYEGSAIPSLSINGGSDVLPTKAKWQYRIVTGSMLRVDNISLADGGVSYAMQCSACLSFSIPPKSCTVRVFKDGKQLGKYRSLDDIPYELIPSDSLTFKIDAKWDHADYKGSASYEFSSSVAAAPVYNIADSTISSGEFFVVTAKNVSAPQKIEFSSIPEIGVTPTFFKDGELAVALIPINKELAAPGEYAFTFKYGENIQSFTVNVETRSVHDKAYSVDIDRSDANVAAYDSLLRFFGVAGESVRYFDGKFLDYSPSASSGEAKLADVFFGFGHRIVPSGGTAPYRLDGVVYMFANKAEIPAVCNGKVCHVGADPMIGTYVIVDHGFGLKTWYCNLSEVLVSVGDSIEKGRSVGVSGYTGYHNINGVYLITTVHGIPVSPYPIQDDGIYIQG